MPHSAHVSIEPDRERGDLVTMERETERHLDPNLKTLQLTFEIWSHKWCSLRMCNQLMWFMQLDCSASSTALSV